MSAAVSSLLTLTGFAEEIAVTVAAVLLLLQLQISTLPRCSYLYDAVWW